MMNIFFDELYNSFCSVDFLCSSGDPSLIGLIILAFTGLHLASIAAMYGAVAIVIVAALASFVAAVSLAFVQMLYFNLCETIKTKNR